MFIFLIVILYSNTFTDREKQESMNLFLGVIKPSEITKITKRQGSDRSLMSCTPHSISFESVDSQQSLVLNTVFYDQNYSCDPCFLNNLMPQFLYILPPYANIVSMNNICSSHYDLQRPLYHWTSLFLFKYEQSLYPYPIHVQRIFSLFSIIF